MDGAGGRRRAATRAGAARRRRGRRRRGLRVRARADAGSVIGDDPMLLCLPAGHRLSAQAEIDLADLAGELWFGGDGCPSVAGAGRAVPRRRLHAGVQPAPDPRLRSDAGPGRDPRPRRPDPGAGARRAAARRRDPPAAARAAPAHAALRAAPRHIRSAERFGDELRAALVWPVNRVAGCVAPTTRPAVRRILDQTVNGGLAPSSTSSPGISFTSVHAQVAPRCCERLGERARRARRRRRPARGTRFTSPSRLGAGQSQRRVGGESRRDVARRRGRRDRPSPSSPVPLARRGEPAASGSFTCARPREASCRTCGPIAPARSVADRRTRDARARRG